MRYCIEMQRDGASEDSEVEVVAEVKPTQPVEPIKSMEPPTLVVEDYPKPTMVSLPSVSLKVVDMSFSYRMRGCSPRFLLVSCSHCTNQDYDRRWWRKRTLIRSPSHR